VAHAERRFPRACPAVNSPSSLLACTATHKCGSHAW
jgi:hypothetical protein